MEHVQASQHLRTAAGWLPTRVRIVEVGPRDGLQNERIPIAIEDRLRLIEGLIAAGLEIIEVGSFVSGKRVPQMAGTDRLLMQLGRRRDLSFPVLVPNLIGLDAALAAGAETIAVFAASTESFASRNLNATVEGSLRNFEAVVRRARREGLRVRGYVSCAVHCPYEGWVDPGRVADIANALIAMGCFEVSLCDTTGAGRPREARAMVEAVAKAVPLEQLAVHFHDTYGQALANTLICLQLGVATVDSAVAGLGGCPFAPGAAGNLATEDLVYMLRGLGIETGVDLAALAAAGRGIMTALGRASTSRVAVAMARTVECAP